jgi:hypothetical protein
VQVQQFVNADCLAIERIVELVENRYEAVYLVALFAQVKDVWVREKPIEGNVWPNRRIRLNRERSQEWVGSGCGSAPAVYRLIYILV